MTVVARSNYKIVKGGSILIIVSKVLVLNQELKMKGCISKARHGVMS